MLAAVSDPCGERFKRFGWAISDPLPQRQGLYHELDQRGIFAGRMIGGCWRHHQLQFPDLPDGGDGHLNRQRLIVSQGLVERRQLHFDAQGVFADLDALDQSRPRLAAIACVTE